MSKIGIPELPADERAQYAAQEQEFLVLTAGIGVGAGTISMKPKKWCAYIGTLGCVCLNDQRKSDQRGRIKWRITNEDADARAFAKQFETLTVYRIKGLLPKQDADAPLQTIYVTEILAQGEQDDFLDGVLAAYQTVVTLHSDLLGDLTLDREMEWYEGEAEFCGTTIQVTLSSEDTDADLTAALRQMEAFFAAQEKQNTMLRQFAAKELTELANDWAYDAFEGDEGEEPPEITEEEFAERLEPESVGFEPDGSYTFYFGDGDFFGGHSVTVYGNVKSGPEEAAMEG